MDYILSRLTAAFLVIALLVATIGFSGAAAAQDRNRQEQDGFFDDAFDSLAHMADQLGWHNSWGDHNHDDHRNDHQTKAHHEGPGSTHRDDDQRHSQMLIKQ